MRATIKALLEKALMTIKDEGALPTDFQTDIQVQNTKDKSHGDFSTNIALVLAQSCMKSPKEIANTLIHAIPKDKKIAKIEIAGPGFINFFINTDEQTQTIATILSKKERYGQNNIGQGRRVLIEYVSANPTGPLHVGHGRSAAHGACVANLLHTAGFDVVREYYVNDAGRQMNILAASVWLRYLEALGEKITFPINGYRGDYVNLIAQDIYTESDETYLHHWSAVIQDLPLDEDKGGDKEVYIDAIIKRAQTLLGDDGFEHFHQKALTSVLSDIKQDLAEFGVEYDNWFSERSLFTDSAIEKGIQAIKNAGETYEKDDALWFKSTNFGDDKDRVLKRANGQTTYFASDVAYHWNKYNRGFDKVIDIFGADHHGYIPRVKAAMKALGHDEKDLEFHLVQFAILYRGKERVQMSTRSGSFVTLRELREEVGNDAARFFYVMRKAEQHMDFDLELAKSQSNDNPVYYLQYAHARICSVLEQLKERGLDANEELGLASLELLTMPHEIKLVQLLAQYSEKIEAAAKDAEPHLIAYYLRDLATCLHSYYNAVTLLCEQHELRAARLCLLKAVKQVLRNGMTILGVSTPRKM